MGIIFQKEQGEALQGLSEQNNGEAVLSKSTVGLTMSATHSPHDLRQISSLKASVAHL